MRTLPLSAVCGRSRAERPGSSGSGCPYEPCRCPRSPVLDLRGREARAQVAHAHLAVIGRRGGAGRTAGKLGTQVAHADLAVGVAALSRRRESLVIPETNLAAVLDLEAKV